VTLQDDLASQPPSSVALSGYNLRQCYSTAIIRLVNGLVDPLQSGVYARSIASIAAQLGLPGWLVEVRHAATHEELPSLEVLREAAHEVSFPLPFRSRDLLTDAPTPPLVPKMAISQLFHAGAPSLVGGTC
jgi:ribosomal biogenesis protein LAS1